MLLEKLSLSSTIIMFNFKQLRKIYNHIDVNNIKKIVYNKPVDDGLKKIINETDFSWKEMISYSNECNTHMEIVCEDIKMNFYYINEIHIPLVRIVNMLKSIMCLKTYLKIQKSFTFHIFCYDCPKVMPKMDEILSPKHINSGFTILNKDDIIIIRLEEWTKTILHEILHHCIDIHKDNYSLEQLKRLRERFHLSPRLYLLPNEAVVEFFTTIYFCTFLSFETGVSREYLLDEEMKNSIIQSNKILHLQGKKQWFENTNAFCYIVFKTILLIKYKNIIKNMKFPYDTEYIVRILLQHSKIPKTDLVKHDRSLKMMSYSF